MIIAQHGNFTIVVTQSNAKVESKKDADGEKKEGEAEKKEWSLGNVKFTLHYKLLFDKLEGIRSSECCTIPSFLKYTPLKVNLRVVIKISKYLK